MMQEDQEIKGVFIQHLNAKSSFHFSQRALIREHIYMKEECDFHKSSEI